MPFSGGLKRGGGSGGEEGNCFAANTSSPVQQAEPAWGTHHVHTPHLLTRWIRKRTFSSLPWQCNKNNTTVWTRNKEVPQAERRYSYGKTHIQSSWFSEFHMWMWKCFGRPTSIIHQFLKLLFPKSKFYVVISLVFPMKLKWIEKAMDERFLIHKFSEKDVWINVTNSASS